jgi:anti-anti-sigma factor
MSSGPANPTPLSVTQDRDGDRVCVAVAGEIDARTADKFRTAMTEALGVGVRWLIVDLAGVSFLDSSGIAALVNARNHAEAVGARLNVINCQPRVRRILEITGVYAALTDRPRPH